jgi:hypothetical protein
MDLQSNEFLDLGPDTAVSLLSFMHIAERLKDEQPLLHFR